MRTWVPREGDIESQWWLVDAAGLTLGRLSTEVASRLRGKHKPAFTPYADTGDHVIVINAEKVVLSGTKWQDKMYRNHSGYPGGLKEITAEKLRDRYPERIIEHAVRGMLPKGPLGRKVARKLKVYAGDKHPHEAQRPEVLPLPDAARAAR
jgi:large subunit ribosomal protein L13